MCAEAVPLELADATGGDDFEAIHGWFGLSYANYLVLPRTLLQSMPDAWQTRFVACLRELDQAFDHVEQALAYRVTPVDEGGRVISEPVPHYERGRARVEPRA